MSGVRYTLSVEMYAPVKGAYALVRAEYCLGNWAAVQALSERYAALGARVSWVRSDRPETVS